MLPDCFTGNDAANKDCIEIHGMLGSGQPARVESGLVFWLIHDSLYTGQQRNSVEPFHITIITHYHLLKTRPHPVTDVFLPCLK